MKGLYVATGFVGLGLGTWVCVILINGMRKRIARINQSRRDRRSGSGTYR